MSATEPVRNRKVGASVAHSRASWLLIALLSACSAPIEKFVDGGETPADDGGSGGGDAMVTPSLKLATTTASVAPGETVSFRVEVKGLSDDRVEWSVDESGGGTVNAAGVYLAPQKTGVFHVRVVSVAQPELFDLGEVTVTPAGKIALYPERVRLYPGESFRLLAVDSAGAPNDAVFSVVTPNGGTIVPPGLYIAPTKPGRYTVKVSKASQPSVSDTSTIIVRSPTRKMTGTVRATPSLPGRIFVQVVPDDQDDGTRLMGTTIDGPGAYSVDGFDEPGRYGIAAWVDTDGSTNVYAAPPPQVVTYYDFDGTDFTVDLDLTVPALSTFARAAVTDVAPLNNAAIVQWSLHIGADELEVADRYRVLWGATPALTVTNAAGSTEVAATGRNFLIVQGLSAAAPMYFAVQGRVNGTWETPSAAFGPVTVGAPRAGASITINASLFSHTVPSNGALWAVARRYDPDDRIFPAVLRNSACRISPASSMSCQLDGLTPGSYELTLFLDANGNGTWDPLERASNNNERVGVTVSAGQGPVTVPLALRDGAVDVVPRLWQRGAATAGQWAIVLWVSGLDETPVLMRARDIPTVQGGYDTLMHQEQQTALFRMAWPNWRIYELGQHRPQAGEKMTIDLLYASGRSSTISVPLPTNPTPFNG